MVGTNTVIGVDSDVNIVDRLGPMIAACKPSLKVTAVDKHSL